MSGTLPNQVFNGDQVKAVEQIYAREHGGDCYDLMLKAGRAVYDQITKLQSRELNVWVFAGKGNNGGDGLVVASLLLGAGISHRVFSLGQPREGTEAHKAFVDYTSKGGRIEYELPPDNSNPPDVIVDALLGTGLKSAPKPPCDDWILFINRSHAFTISVDAPSGLNADTGVVIEDCVRADVTVCMLALKCGLLTSDAVDYAGKIVFASLDFDVSNFWGSGSSINPPEALPMLQKTYEDITDTLPVRMRSAHKGDAGKVLVIGGAQGFCGAVCISALGALRAGAGLVKAATCADSIAAINARCPEIMTVDFTREDEMTKALDFADVIAIGPGLGQDDHAAELLSLVKDTDKPVIYDADALNLIARGEGEAARRCVLTPHPAECARLLETDIEEILNDRFRACQNLQKRYGGACLLKGAGSIICDGRFLTVVNEGSPAMASGGMGDLLTGMVAALIAQGMAPRDALLGAACIHGRAGYMAGQDSGVIGTIATDLLVYVHSLVNGNDFN